MPKALGILFLTILIAGCDGDNELDCFTIEEVRESDCLADAMLNSCDRISCSSANADLFPPLTPNCEFVDCESFDCEEVRYNIDDMLIIGPGTFTDLHLGETGGFDGIINVEGEDEVAECFFVVP
ncbi:MAG: hypothetical protein AB1598_03125 [Thermodesulfobacteriota bacterium]